jgi:hypothetical protein
VRLLIEIVSIVAGLIAAAVIASYSAWAYPRGAADIWLVAYVCMALTVLLGIGSVRRAFRRDRETLRRNGTAGDG